MEADEMTTQYPDDVQPIENPNSPPPVVVDLGKRGRRAIKRLREGEGKLFAEVSDVVDRLRRDGAVKADAQIVVVVVRQRRNRGDYQTDWSARC
jgi:hypothetical protein